MVIRFKRVSVCYPFVVLSHAFKKPFEKISICLNGLPIHSKKISIRSNGSAIH